MSHGRQRHREPDDESQPKRGPERGPAHGRRVAEAVAQWEPREQHAIAGGRDRRSRDGRAQSQDHRLDHNLPGETRASGAERRPQSELRAAVGRAREHERCGIGARDDQQQRDGAK